MGYAPNDPRRGGALPYGRHEDAFLDSMSCCPTLHDLSGLPMAPLGSDSPSLPTGRTSGLPQDLHQP